MKTANLKLLNAINAKLVEVANESGIDLRKEFGTPEKFKEFVVSFTIKSVMDIRGISVEKAFDTVMGEGSFDALALAVWNDLNPEGGAA